MRIPRKLYVSTERVLEMYEYYCQNKTLPEVAEKFGSSSSQVVSRLFRREKLVIRKFTVSKKFIFAHKSKQRILPKSQLRKLYLDQKLTMLEIADQLSCSAHRVWQSLIYHKIPRCSSERRIKNPALTDDLLCRLFLEEKKSVEEIAILYKYAPITIYKKLTKLNIPVTKAENERSKSRPSRTCLPSG